MGTSILLDMVALVLFIFVLAKFMKGSERIGSVRIVILYLSLLLIAAVAIQRHTKFYSWSSEFFYVYPENRNISPEPTSGELCIANIVGGLSYGLVMALVFQLIKRKSEHFYVIAVIGFVPVIMEYLFHWNYWNVWIFHPDEGIQSGVLIFSQIAPFVIAGLGAVLTEIFIAPSASGHSRVPFHNSQTPVR
jgi:hypothetical protein